MKPPANAHIALLRGINVGGRNRILMAQLRSLCSELGWSNVRTYIQSGNILFEAKGGAANLETQLESAIEKRFGLAIPVVIRTVTTWQKDTKNNAFPNASAKEPNLVMLGLSKSAPVPGAVSALLERAAHGERIVQVGNVLWMHFGEGVARSKLAPKLIDRMVGSIVTLRNWRTVQKLNQLLAESV